jgi:hypothetical protein
MDHADHHLDGNSAAGMLSDLFTFEVTTARTVCGGCGVENEVGRLMAYGLHMGVVLRCPGCDAVLLRVGRNRAGSWLDLRGASVLSIPSQAD